MITNHQFKIYGGDSSKKTSVSHAASAATPSDISPVGAPAIHLVSGASGSGKSEVSRNIISAYLAAHDGVKSKPDLIVYSGAGHDPVWDGLNPARGKVYGPEGEQSFIDDVTERYDRALTAKVDVGSPAPSDLGRSATRHNITAPQTPSDSKTHKPVAIVIDDAANSSLLPAQLKQSPIGLPLQAHRHADMTFIASSQRYHSHNPWLRENASTVSFFPPTSSDEQKFLETSLPIPKAALRRGIAVAKTRGRHHFIHVDIRGRKATHGFSGIEI